MGYKGLIAEIPLGPDGLTGSKNLSAVGPGQLLKARNITYENGTLEKEGGSTEYTTVSLGTGTRVIGGWDWWPTPSVQRSIIVTSTMLVKKDSGAGSYPTTLCTLGSTTDVVPVFVECGKEAAANNRKLALFTGVNPVKVLSADGATMATLASGPSDWSGTGQPKTGLVHEGRLWGFRGDRGYYSRTDSHEGFNGSGAGSLAIYPGEGEEIVASCVFGPYIIVWKKPRGIYLIDTTSTDTASWKVSRVTRDLGIASPLAFAVIEGDVVFKDLSGELFALSSVTELTDIRPRPISDLAQLGPWIRENENGAQYHKVQMLYYPAKRQAWQAVAAAGNTTNTLRLKADLSIPGKPRFAYADFVTCESLWLRKDADGVARPVAGDASGHVWLLDQETRGHNSAGYAYEVQTPHTDLSYLDPALATKRKNFQFLELVFEPQGAWNLNVDILGDGETIQTVAVGMGGGTAVLGETTTLDDDFILSGDQVITRRKRIVGGGRRFSMVLRNSGNGENVSVARAYLHFTPGDER